MYTTKRSDLRRRNCRDKSISNTHDVLRKRTVHSGVNRKGRDLVSSTVNVVTTLFDTPKVDDPRTSVKRSGLVESSKGKRKGHTRSKRSVSLVVLVSGLWVLLYFKSLVKHPGTRTTGTGILLYGFFLALVKEVSVLEKYYKNEVLVSSDNVVLV